MQFVHLRRFPQFYFQSVIAFVFWERDPSPKEQWCLLLFFTINNSLMASLQGHSPELSVRAGYGSFRPKPTKNPARRDEILGKTFLFTICFRCRPSLHSSSITLPPRRKRQHEHR
jgi:hypothetical protein